MENGSTARSCAACRAAIYRKINKITAVSILAQGPHATIVYPRAWAYVGQLAREIQGDLLRIGDIEAGIVDKAISPISRGPEEEADRTWRGRICEE